MIHEKGIIVSNARAFVESRFGAARWRTLLAGMEPADAAALESAVATAWYDVGLVMRLFHRMVGDLGAGDPTLLVDFARYQAGRDITITYRLFFRLANPAYVLEKAMSYWDRFHNSGSWVIERPTPTSARGTLSDFPIDDPLFCAHLNAYIARMFELVGARDVRTEHTRCRTRGHPACVFVASWR